MKWGMSSDCSRSWRGCLQEVGEKLPQGTEVCDGGTYSPARAAAKARGGQETGLSALCGGRKSGRIVVSAP